MNRILFCFGLVAGVLGTLPLAYSVDNREAPLSVSGPSNATPLFHLEFSSGEVVTFEKATRNLQVHIYLDSEGNASETTLSLQIGDFTEITDGEKNLSPEFLTSGKEVDVEYDSDKMEATYIFVY